MSPLSIDGTSYFSKPLALLTLAHVLGTVGYVSIMAMAPIIRTDLYLNATQVGSFMSAFYLALTVSALPAGTMVDHIGVVWALAISMVLLAFGTLTFALAEEYLLAVASTFIMGLGYGLVNPATAKGVLVVMMCGGGLTCFVAGLIGEAWPVLFLAILAGIMGATILAYAPMLHTVCSEAVEPRLAGAAIGSNLLATSVGGAIGPLVFGAVVDASSGSYTVAWFLVAGVVLTGVLIVAIGLREKPAYSNHD